MKFIEYVVIMIHHLFYMDEGWNMPTNLPDSEKAMQYNHDKLLNVSFFNDTFQ